LGIGAKNPCWAPGALRDIGGEKLGGGPRGEYIWGPWGHYKKEKVVPPPREIYSVGAHPKRRGCHQKFGEKRGQTPNIMGGNTKILWGQLGGKITPDPH